MEFFDAVSLASSFDDISDEIFDGMRPASNLIDVQLRSVFCAS
jgi:hypothetical protein